MLEKFQHDIKNNFDKEIYFIKVIIGDFCPLDCKYCYVDKSGKNEMSWTNFKRIIFLLVSSKGDEKLLHILGGEPLMYFDIIKKGVIYARSLEKEFNKKLNISFCTSGITFDEEKLNFIEENEIFLAWSIDGPSSIHDKNRIINGGKGSYSIVKNKKDLVTSIVSNRYLGVAMTVGPDTVKNLFKSYVYLVNKEGFECSFNIAPVEKVGGWKKKDMDIFIRELSKIYKYVFDQIGKGRFLYINTFNKEFGLGMISNLRRNGGRCLWFYLDAFPNGDITMNPFVNDDNYDEYIVGNIGSDTFLEDINDYIGCNFDNTSKQCKDCRDEYNYDNNGDDTSSILTSYRDKISLFFVDKIKKEAKLNDNYKKFIEESIEQMYV